jgi:hypothetical protein
MITKACLKARRLQRSTRRAKPEDAYYVGDEARHNGEPESANPFAPATQDHADWSAGWREALP